MSRAETGVLVEVGVSVSVTVGIGVVVTVDVEVGASVGEEVAASVAVGLGVGVGHPLETVFVHYRAVSIRASEASVVDPRRRGIVPVTVVGGGLRPWPVSRMQETGAVAVGGRQNPRLPGRGSLPRSKAESPRRSRAEVHFCYRSSIFPFCLSGVEVGFFSSPSVVLQDNACLDSPGTDSIDQFHCVERNRVASDKILIAIALKRSRNNRAIGVYDISGQNRRSINSDVDCPFVGSRVVL